MMHPRTFSKEYLRVRDRLSRGEQIYLGAVEDEIAESPDTRPNGRFETGDHRYATVEGFIIKYRLISGGPVVFDELQDLRATV